MAIWHRRCNSAQRPGTTGREVWLGPCRQATGGADEVGQAGLACLHPALVHAIAIADQEPLPVVDQGREGFFGPVGMNHVERHRVTGHHPQPLQRVGEEPRGFINVVDRSPAGVQRNRVIVRGDRLRHPVEHLLDRSQAQGHPQHGGAKGLDHPPPVAIGPGQFADQGTETRPIARGMLGGKLCLAPCATAPTASLIQHPVRDLHLDGRQLKHLVGLVGRRHAKHRVATATPLGLQLVHRRWRQQHLAMPDMPRFAARFAGRGRRRAPVRLRVRMVRRRRPVGRGRVLLETRLQDFHTALEVSELGQIVLHREQIRLDRGRGLLPILVRKGKGPGGAIGAGG